MKRNIAFVILFALFACQELHAYANSPKKTTKSTSLPNLLYGSALVGATLSLLYRSINYHKDHICSTHVYSTNKYVRREELILNAITKIAAFYPIFINMIIITACTYGLIQTNKDERKEELRRKYDWMV